MSELTVQQQKDWAVLAVNQSKTYEVMDQQSYSNAAELLKDIKHRINQITDYWKPLKAAAAKQHKDICAKERELLSPFSQAESDLKGKMADWQKQKLEEERLAREEFERLKREEEEQLMQAAIEAEKEGDSARAEFMVEAAENIASAVMKQPKAEKTIGTAARSIWKARITNEPKVPVTFAGIMLRPVDDKVLDKLAKSSKGEMQIPGVEFYEDISISVRTR